MSTKLHARQIFSRDTLERLFPNTNPQELDDLLRSINSELTPIFEIRANNPANLTVNIGPRDLQNPTSNYRRTVPPIKLGIPNLTGTPNIAFPSADGGNVVATPGNTIVLNCPSGQYTPVLVCVTKDNQIFVSQGAPAASASAALNNTPKLKSGHLPIGVIVVFNDSGTIANITPDRIYQFGSGGGGAGGAGGAAVDLIAGENIAAKRPVYISTGSSDGGRTAGRAYLVDPDHENNIRKRLVGIADDAINTGDEGTIILSGLVEEIPAAIINGGAFTDGLPVYWDGTQYTQTNIVAGRKWGCFVGMPASANSLIVRSLDQIENDANENAITDETLTFNSLHDSDSFQYLSRVVVANRSDLALIDATPTTALVNIANKTYQFISNGDLIRTVDLLDPTYLSEGKDVDEVKVVSIFKSDDLSNNFTYSVSRDNGVNWENVTMTRFEQTSLYTGTRKFTTDTYATTGSLTNDTYLVLNTTTQRRIGQRLVVGANPLISRTFQISVNKVGSPSGYLIVKLVKESGSAPSNSVADILAQQDFNIASVSSGTLNVDFGKVVLRNNTNYYIVIEATDAYYSSFVSGTTEMRINTLAVSGTGLAFTNDGTAWSPNTSRDVVFTYENKVFRLLLRITATAANAGQIRAIGLFYGKEKIEITPTIYSTFIVGTQQQVDLGLATHASLTSALNEIINNVGGKIILLNSTIVGNVTWNKSGVVLEGYGRGSVIDGNLTISGHNNIIKGVVIDGNLTISGDYNTINESWLDGGTLSNTGSGNSINLIWDI